ncbi:transglycosylase domain-containing protein [bacterium]|nr:transglycosylase domain-containing protein [bacterium]
MEEDSRKLMHRNFKLKCQKRKKLALLQRVRRLKAPTSLLLVALSCLSLSARAGFSDWLNDKLPYKLPTEKLNFQKIKPQDIRVVYDGDEQPILYEESKKNPLVQFYRPLKSIDPKLVQFVVLLEDAKFFQHTGLDMSEIKKAFSDNLSKGKVKRGASTISQQLVKNLFLDKEKSMVRKLFEIPWVKRVETDLSKEQILDLYLNIIEWGPGIYGAEAASRHYFDKGSNDLNLSEALALALIIPNPKRFDPYLGSKNLDFIEKKKKAFVQRLISENFIERNDSFFILSEKTSLAPLNLSKRKFPLLHSGKYFPNTLKENKKSDLLYKALTHLGPFPFKSSRNNTSLSKELFSTLSDYYPDYIEPKSGQTWLLVRANQKAFIKLPPDETPIEIEGANWELKTGLTWKDLIN